MIYFFLIVYTALTGLALLLYLPKLIGFRYAFKRAPHPIAKEKRRIALVVPARRESKIIGDLFASISAQDYDPSAFDVNVIVKEPDDPTIGLAKKIGANVFVVPEQKCKGDALDGYFKSLSPEQLSSYAAFVIVDADAVLSPSYVRELNNALEQRYDIYITRKYAKNFLGGKRNRTVFSNCSALTWPIIDDLGNAYRVQREMPLNLCGQGMMIRSEIIKTLGGWPYRTLTEDYELKLDSLLRGFTSTFCPYAVLYTEEALGHHENFLRRVRWLTGYKQCDRKYKEKIRAQARARGKYSRGEFEYFFGTVPLVLFAVTTFATMLFGGALSINYAILGDPRWDNAFVMLVAAPFLVMYFLLFAYGVLAYFAYRGTFRLLSHGERFLMLVYNPFYLLEYFPIYLKSWNYVRKDRSPAWKQTERSEYDKAAPPSGKSGK